MSKPPRLEARSLPLTLAAALLSTLLLGLGQTADVIPFGDGVGFAKRAIELHGLLHAGQLGSFFTLLTSPSTFTFLPTYSLFFLVPTSLANGATYGAITCLCWNLTLAFGLYGILKAMGRPQMAPWLFLLATANNYALDAGYYFYMDLAFMGWALMAVWLQVLAWQKQTWRISLGAGLLAGSLFMVKPANAFLFLGLFFVTEAAHFTWQVFVPRYAGAGAARKEVLPVLVVAGGALISFVIALPFGLLQVIASRMAAMQADYARTVLHAGPLLRAFYFPLCLTYFYSALWLGILAALVAAAVRFARKAKPSTETNAFAGGVVACLSFSYLVVWGLAFSFVMPAKVVRSLPLMLPILWVAVSHIPIVRRLPIWGVAGFAVAYFTIAHLQSFVGFVPKANLIAEGFQLEGDWLNRLPGQKDLKNRGVQIARDVEKALSAIGIRDGKIADGTEMMFWTATSLNWYTQVPDLQKGQKPAREFVTACDNRGYPIQSALDGCNALLLVVHPSLQYSQGVFEFNVKTANYAIKKWQGNAVRDMRVFNAGDGKPLMVVVALREPLSKQSLETLMSSEFPQGFSTFAALEQSFDKPKTLKECLAMIFSQARR